MSQEFGYPQYNAQGMKVLSRAGELPNDMMMDIAVFHLRSGEQLKICQEQAETAVLLVKGAVRYGWEGREEEAIRDSFIEDSPYCLHVAGNVEVVVTALEASEVLVQSTENDRNFPSVFYGPKDCRNDIFGKGVLENKIERTVRTIFDYTNAPYSNMVMGEVINHQGGWSSYTPHHHPQPEVYYYRYERPEGFGACFIGDSVYKIVDGAVASIPGGKTHPQVTAPAFPMYYCWMIRHLPGDPWTGRIVDERYTWIDARMG